MRTLGELPGGPPVVVIHLVEVTYSDDEGGTELYQVPLSFYEQPENRLDHAFVGWWEDSDHGWQHAYDALHDREAMALWQRAFDAQRPRPAATRGSTGCRATSSTWRRTRRCSAASSPTPRWPSARTR